MNNQHLAIMTDRDECYMAVVTIGEHNSRFVMAQFIAGNSDGCYQYYVLCPHCKDRNYIHAGVVSEYDFISNLLYQKVHGGGVCRHYTGWFFLTEDASHRRDYYFQFVMLEGE